MSVELCSYVIGQMMMARIQNSLEAIRRDLKDGIFRIMGAKELELVPTEIAGLGNEAYEAGMAIVYGADREVIDRRRYLTIWIKEDGRWKIHRNIWNSDLPLEEEQVVVEETED